MSYYFQNSRFKLPLRIIIFCLILTFGTSLIIPPRNLYAQTMPTAGNVLGLNLPAPGSMLPLSVGFRPPVIKAVTVDPKNPFMFDFLIDGGDENLQGEELRDVSQKLVKYFLASLTTPEEDMWVNLSPYESDRIVPEAFGKSEMGRDLLAQDYILKQLTASLIYPEDELGQKFWDKVYKKAQSIHGTADIPLNTFNKVWIVPQKAVVFERGQTAIVVESYLKVMLEEDYLAMEYDQQHNEDGRGETDLQSSIIRETIIPAIEKEVNEGKHFVQLRQIYHSFILAAWFKRRLKEGVLAKIYVDQNKIAGVDVEDKNIKQKIYHQYLEAYKKGVYNYIKEDYDPMTQQVIPRKYFSGGTKMDSAKVTIENDAAMLSSAALENLESAITNGLTKVRVALSSSARQGLDGLKKVGGLSKVIGAKNQDQEMVSASAIEQLRTRIISLLKGIESKYVQSGVDDINRAKYSNDQVVSLAQLIFNDIINGDSALWDQVDADGEPIAIGLLNPIFASIKEKPELWRKTLPDKPEYTMMGALFRPIFKKQSKPEIWSRLDILYKEIWINVPDLGLTLLNQMLYHMIEFNNFNNNNKLRFNEDGYSYAHVVVDAIDLDVRLGIIDEALNRTKGINMAQWFEQTMQDDTEGSKRQALKMAQIVLRLLLVKPKYVREHFNNITILEHVKPRVSNFAGTHRSGVAEIVENIVETRLSNIEQVVLVDSARANHNEQFEQSAIFNFMEGIYKFMRATTNMDEYKRRAQRVRREILKLARGPQKREFIQEYNDIKEGDILISDNLAEGRMPALWSISIVTDTVEENLFVTRLYPIEAGVQLEKDDLLEKGSPKIERLNLSEQDFDTILNALSDVDAKGQGEAGNDKAMMSYEAEQLRTEIEGYLNDVEAGKLWLDPEDLPNDMSVPEEESLVVTVFTKIIEGSNDLWDQVDDDGRPVAMELMDPIFASIKANPDLWYQELPDDPEYTMMGALFRPMFKRQIRPEIWPRLYILYKEIWRNIPDLGLTLLNQMLYHIIFFSDFMNQSGLNGTGYSYAHTVVDSMALGVELDIINEVLEAQGTNIEQWFEQTMQDSTEDSKRRAKKMATTVLRLLLVKPEYVHEHFNNKTILEYIKPRIRNFSGKTQDGVAEIVEGIVKTRLSNIGETVLVDSARANHNEAFERKAVFQFMVGIHNFMRTTTNTDEYDRKAQRVRNKILELAESPQKSEFIHDPKDIIEGDILMSDYFGKDLNAVLASIVIVTDTIEENLFATRLYPIEGGVRLPTNVLELDLMRVKRLNLSEQDLKDVLNSLSEIKSESDSDKAMMSDEVEKLRVEINRYLRNIESGSLVLDPEDLPFDGQARKSLVALIFEQIINGTNDLWDRDAPVAMELMNPIFASIKANPELWRQKLSDDSEYTMMGALFRPIFRKISEPKVWPRLDVLYKEVWKNIPDLGLTLLNQMLHHMITFNDFTTERGLSESAYSYAHIVVDSITLGVQLDMIEEVLNSQDMNMAQWFEQTIQDGTAEAQKRAQKMAKIVLRLLLLKPDYVREYLRSTKILEYVKLHISNFAGTQDDGVAEIVEDVVKTRLINIDSQVATNLPRANHNEQFEQSTVFDFMKGVDQFLRATTNTDEYEQRAKRVRSEILKLAEGARKIEVIREYEKIKEGDVLISDDLGEGEGSALASILVVTDAIERYKLATQLYPSSAGRIVPRDFYQIKVERLNLSEQDFKTILSALSDVDAEGQGESGNDKAMMGKDVGGIKLKGKDLDLQIQTDGQGELIMPDLDLQNLDNIQIDGFTPIIINITPAVNVRLLLGLSESDVESLASLRG